MKKFLLIAAIVLCVSASVFADGFIGVETGLDINWMKEKQSGHDTGDTSTMSLAVGAAGVHYFTDSIGLGYGLGMEFPLLSKWEDSDYQDIENVANVFKGDLSFQFKHDFSEKMALEADDLADIKAKTENLMQASLKLGEAMYKQAAPEGASAGANAGADAGQAQTGNGDEKVVDADFEEVK